jgi:hypothetical protein
LSKLFGEQWESNETQTITIPIPHPNCLVIPDKGLGSALNLPMGTSNYMMTSNGSNLLGSKEFSATTLPRPHFHNE